MVSTAEKRLHHDFCSLLFPSRSLIGLPFAFWLRSGTWAREGRFALSKGRESRVTVCRMYGNLTGVWFSKRAEETSPRANVRLLCTGVRARHGEEGYDCDGDIKTQHPAERESAM